MSLTWAPESSNRSRSLVVPSGRVTENLKKTCVPSAVCPTWLSSMEASLRRIVDGDAERMIAFGCGESRGTSSLRMPGRWEKMAIALGVGVAPAGQAWVQCPPYLAAVSPTLPSLSLSLSLPLLGVDLGGDFNIAFSLPRCSLMSWTAYTPFHEASNTLANRGNLSLGVRYFAFMNDWHTSQVPWSWLQSFFRA